MKTRNFVGWSLAIGLVMYFGSAALAVSITATLQSITPALPSPLDVVHLTGSDAATGDQLSEGVGLLTWSGTAANPPPFNGLFPTYCLDLIDNISPGNTYTFTLDPTISTSPGSTAFPGGVPSTGMGAAKATLMQELFGEAFATSLSSSTDETAFQLGVWSILYNTSTTFQTVNNTSANFYTVSGTDLTPGAINQANTWLADLNPSVQTADLVALLGDGTSQDQIAPLSFNLTGGNAPLPPAALGGAILLAGLAAVRGWRHMRVRSA